MYLAVLFKFKLSSEDAPTVPCDNKFHSMKAMGKYKFLNKKSHISPGLVTLVLEGNIDYSLFLPWFNRNILRRNNIFAIISLLKLTEQGKRKTEKEGQTGGSQSYTFVAFFL